MVCELPFGLVILWVWFPDFVVCWYSKGFGAYTFGDSRFGAGFCCLVWLGFGFAIFVAFWFDVLDVVLSVLHGLVCIGLRIFMFACRRWC